MAKNIRAIVETQTIVDELVRTIQTISEDDSGTASAKERAWAVTGAVTMATRTLLRLGMPDGAREVMAAFRESIMERASRDDLSDQG